MAMADNPISRRNFLYGMVGTGAAVTLGRRVVGSGRVEARSADAASSSPSGHPDLHELGLGGSYDAEP